MNNSKIKTLLLDIGGVLLTNGWGRDSRQLAYERFQLDETETEERHQLVFDTFELGKLTFEDYLRYVIFYQSRSFTREEFIEFNFEKMRALDGAIDFFMRLKKANQLKVIALNNEPREINEYRIQKFRLDLLFDAFVSSGHVHLRKPDFDIYKLGLEVSQTPKEETLYIDDRLLYTEVATGLGIPSLHYQGLEMARDFFNKEGLNTSN